MKTKYPTVGELYKDKDGILRVPVLFSNTNRRAFKSLNDLIKYYRKQWSLKIIY